MSFSALSASSGSQLCCSVRRMVAYNVLGSRYERAALDRRLAAEPERLGKRRGAVDDEQPQEMTR
jgi:hypothetical protein